MIRKKQFNDLICYSHLRWGFVYQRPQHLMTRFARDRRVFFIEEPEYADVKSPRMKTRLSNGVCVATPVLPREAGERRAASTVSQLVEKLFADHKIGDHVAWFYTPMALDIVPGRRPRVVVYDCMDELSLFKGAPRQLMEREQDLFRISHLVFTGGMSLFEAKRRQHGSVYAFPSSVDYNHFAKARNLEDVMEDQCSLGRPRLGYAGVIDERIDLDLIDYIARIRPEWQIVMVGPTAKIDASSLPQRPNIHWLGMKSYDDLPHYFAGWNAALMPFAINDATKYISPTKTPEYLAAGLPVVSTPVRDVVRQYGQVGLARIGSTFQEFVAEIEYSLTFGMSMKWRERADAFLNTLSWDRTWQEMSSLIDEWENSGAEKTMTATSAPLFSGGVA
jgi:UDP-galactopyranose mutase